MCAMYCQWRMVFFENVFIQQEKRLCAYLTVCIYLTLLHPWRVFFCRTGLAKNWSFVGIFLLLLVEVVGYFTGNSYWRHLVGLWQRFFIYLLWYKFIEHVGVFCILKMVYSPIKKIWLHLTIHILHVRVLFSVIHGDSCSILPDTGNFNKVECEVLAFCIDIEHFDNV